VTLLQIIILGSVQGFTEFLPISSSAHLILVPVLSGWPDQGLAFDVAVHVGTLSAVLFYFRNDIFNMTRDWGLSVARRQRVGQSTLAWGVIWGSIPVGLIGYLFHDYIDSQFRTPLVIAWATIGFGLLLYYSDKIGVRQRKLETLGWYDVLVIGLAQAVALIPGTSRSGITITAGLFLGLTRDAAARFSFLLSIPAILMSGGYKSLQLLVMENVDWLSILYGTVISAVTAFICIHYFLKFLDRIGMLPFVIYRLVLGVFLLYVFL
jgi:undecaprenyl-diphosphatase